jgi:hypothetical protein
VPQRKLAFSEGKASVVTIEVHKCVLTVDSTLTDICAICGDMMELFGYCMRIVFVFTVNCKIRSDYFHISLVL